MGPSLGKLAASLGTIWVQSGYNLDILDTIRFQFRQSGYAWGTIWIQSGYNQSTTRVLLGYNLDTIWVQSGYLVTGTKSLVPGTWHQVPVARYLVPGTRYPVPGTWYQVPGLVPDLVLMWYRLGTETQQIIKSGSDSTKFTSRTNNSLPGPPNSPHGAPISPLFPLRTLGPAAGWAEGILH